MKLTFDQIKSICFGALKLTEETDGIHFQRFTDHQMDVWGNIYSVFRSNASEPSGVRLDFHTDSRTILFQLMVPGVYEVLVDGLHHSTLCAEKQCTKTITAAPGDKRITFLLPCDNPGTLGSVELDEGSYIRPHSYDRKFLFLGDSITQGCTASIPSRNYIHRMGLHYNADILSWAVGGSGFRYETLEDIGFAPDAIFIGYGTNDYACRKSPEEFKERCIAYMDKVVALYPNTKIFCISPLWRADGDLQRVTGTLDDCRAVIIKEITDRNLYHIDGYTIVPHHPDYFDDKRLHPNDIGFSYFVQGVLKAVEGKL